MGNQLCEPFFRWLRSRRVRPYITKHTSVLDVGCGVDGALLQSLAPYFKEGVGIDLRAMPIRKENIRIEQGSFDGTPLPFADQAFDCVTMLAVLEHMDKRDELVKEIYRVLKPGGVLVMTVPTWAAKPVLEFLAFRLGIVNAEAVREHKTYFWKEQLAHILQNAGFSPTSTQLHYFEVGFNLSAIARKA